MSETTTTTEVTPEAVLSLRWNVPRGTFAAWRRDGVLVEDQHWVRDGRAFALTAAGQAAALRIIGAGAAVVEPAIERVAVIAQQAGVHARILRCKPVDGGAMVSVRLMAPRVFASQFRRGDRLMALPTEVEGILEWDGTAPRRVRI